MNTEWYVRLEEGHIGGVSDEVLAINLLSCALCSPAFDDPPAPAPRAS